MNMPEAIQEKVFAALAGFAVGEALSWTTPFNRSQLMPEWLHRIRSDMEKERYHTHITSIPVPFSLNQNPGYLYPGPADLTEWMAWSGSQLLKYGGVFNASMLESSWKPLVDQSEHIHSRISIHAALKNMKKGFTAPESGHFNPHYFDDAVLPRALIIGIVHAKEPTTASAQAALDASFTHYDEGVHSAQALATAMSYVFNNQDMYHIFDSVKMEIPSETLTYKSVCKAFDCVPRAEASPAKLAFLLSREVCSPEYSYGNIAHEILGCALAIVHLTKGDFDQTLATAALLPRLGAGLMAVSGSMAAMMTGLPDTVWLDEAFLTLRGDFVPSVKGLSLIYLAEELTKIMINRNK